MTTVTMQVPGVWPWSLCSYRTSILEVGQFVSYIPGKQRTVKILKIGTPEIISIIVLQLEQLDFTVQYCVQKMQRE